MVDKQKRKAMSMEIAQRLADLRREKGFSQEELANQLGLSRQAISKWERGESAPDMANLIALADLYAITLDELIRGEAPAPAPAAQAAEPEAGTKTPAADKVDVTINTFINDEKSKAAAPEQPSNANAATPVASTASAAPAEAAAPAQACPPPPQMVPVYQTVPHQHLQAQAHIQSQPPKVTNEVWMTFPYPLFCALLYLVLGFLFGLWHPGWIIFLTIPFFYWIVRVVKQDPNYIATHTPGASGVHPGGETGEVTQP